MLPGISLMLSLLFSCNLENCSYLFPNYYLLLITGLMSPSGTDPPSPTSLMTVSFWVPCVLILHNLLRASDMAVYAVFFKQSFLGLWLLDHLPIFPWCRLFLSRSPLWVPASFPLENRCCFQFLSDNLNVLTQVSILLTWWFHLLLSLQLLSMLINTQ